MSRDDDDDECFSVQLDSSDMCPRAHKVAISCSRLDVSIDLCFNQTILRQRFAMRRYNLEQDGRLTHLAKAKE